MLVNLKKTRRKYDVIYADPGWHYGSGGAHSGKYEKLKYTTMKLPQLKEIPVERIAKDNCALFLWATGSHIAEAVGLGTAWGFKFVRVDKVWKKITRNGRKHVVPGPWGVVDAEYILLFTKGKACSLQTERNQHTVYPERHPGIHSGKPELFRHLIERRFAGCNYIELFARSQFKGWDCMGDEL